MNNINPEEIKTVQVTVTLVLDIDKDFVEELASESDNMGEVFTALREEAFDIVHHYVGALDWEECTFSINGKEISGEEVSDYMEQEDNA